MVNKKMHFEISERKILLRFFDVFFILLSLCLVNDSFYFDYFEITRQNFYWTIFLGIYVTFFGTVFEMYNLQVASNTYQITKSIILTSGMTTLFYLLTPFYTPELPSNRLQIILFFFSILSSLILWRYLYVKFFASKRFIKNVVFICSSKKIDIYVKELMKLDPHYNVIGYLSTENDVDDTVVQKIVVEQLNKLIDNGTVSEIVVLEKKNKKQAIKLFSEMLHFLEKGVVIKEYSDVYEQITYRLPIDLDDKGFQNFFPFSRSNQNALYKLYTRGLDLFMSFFGLVVLVLFLPVLFFLNLFWNKGSMFYTQERVGKNGIPFKIYKLRTMIENAEKNGAVFAAKGDQRITPFGRFLRKIRLDEIPQFYNVVLGDMAIIGPRPERPVFVNEIVSNMPLYQTRHVIKPGLTGWAQVNYPYGENLSDSLMKLRYDLYYIKHRSFFLDINILIKTMTTIMFARGN